MDIMTFALTGNTSCLSYNWIYNPAYLKALSQTQSLLFQPLNPDDYVKAEKTFLAYPHMQVGDHSVQADILKWLFAALKKNPDLTAKEYQNLVFDPIKPGGDYVGYVESYGRALVFNKIAKLHRLDIPLLAMDDDQMIGFAPYIACKALNLGNEKAYELAQAFTDKPVFKTYYDIFDTLLEALKIQDMHTAIGHLVKQIPVEADRFKKALNSDTEAFITDTVNTSCHIQDAVPLVFHILYQTSNLPEALEMNAWIGGASADRGTLIGALYHTSGPLDPRLIMK